MVHERDDIEGLDAAILMHPKVWEASGHVAEFTDPLVECRNCHRRFRVDILLAESGAAELPQAQCPSCGKTGEWTEPRNFNLMFKTFMGPVEDSSAVVYLRPETAQGIYVNFLNVQSTARQRVPFGIAQIGKAFRNEITPGNFTFRTREFEQMEMQFFVEPGTDAEWFERWRDARMQWMKETIGLDEPTAPLPPAREAGALRERGRRHRVLLRRHHRRRGVGRDRGDPQPHRLRPPAAPGIQRQAAGVHRPRQPEALPPVHHRDLGGRRPRHAGGAGRADCVRRGHRGSVRECRSSSCERRSGRAAPGRCECRSRPPAGASRRSDAGCGRSPASRSPCPERRA
jgi:hypothetical protein